MEMFLRQSARSLALDDEPPLFGTDHSLSFPSSEIGPQQSTQSGPMTRFAVLRRKSYCVVKLANVLYFELQDTFACAVTRDDRYMLNLSLAAIEQRLPPGEFLRSHRQVLVRIDAIREIIPISSGRFELVIDHPSAPHLPLARQRVALLRDHIEFFR